METLSPFFPLNGSIQKGNARSLLMTILIYVALAAAISLVHWLLSWVAVIGTLLGIISWIVGLYCTVGIVLAVIRYVKS